jgi:uncharacterized membrane protein YeaQ/YmgE (transglycosylase-associated protein family)
MLGLILGLILLGLVLGALARLALPGRDPMTIPQTILIGIAGSLIAGLLVRVFTNKPGASFFAAFVVTVGLVYIVRRTRGGGLTSPGGRR